MKKAKIYWDGFLELLFMIFIMPIWALGFILVFSTITLCWEFYYGVYLKYLAPKKARDKRLQELQESHEYNRQLLLKRGYCCHTGCEACPWNGDGPDRSSTQP